ncbi:hypothetical protein B7R22_17085 [Subtercola boreus]|uniref:Uncharacterized protein n=1 Tax=Subtercola boreus TaxID=120213 RepID=A0A3E0VQ72_9MICO|nr:hypothetical protein [Subtercola boreus]RFA12144.1 hypothetical protein B7R22_17085 [Subtercola boreus]
MTDPQMTDESKARDLTELLAGKELQRMALAVPQDLFDAEYADAGPLERAVADDGLKRGMILLTPSKDGACESCGNTGVVGSPPDAYMDCPACSGTDNSDDRTDDRP